MGIPSYFSYIVKNHPEIIRRFTKELQRNLLSNGHDNSDGEFIINNLYLDCNSIIYDAVHNTKFSDITSDSSKIIISKVIAKIEEYITLIAPTTCVFIAFDGVAPLAKLDQQRERRYKSWYQSDITQKIMNLKKTDVWNTTAITPGTVFMSELNNAIKNHFGVFTRDNGLKYIISTSDEAGEGEHKLFAFIRENPELHDSKTRSIVYGLDADLIMLSINHLPVCPNIYLFRETPHFIQSIDSSLEPDKTYLLDIPLLVQQIRNEMGGFVGVSDDEDGNEPSDNVNIVYDYIFICFFLGNDFMPHFPSINIRTGGIHKMMNAYKATFGNSAGGSGSGSGKEKYLTDGKKINWKHVRTMVDFLAKNEVGFLKEELKMRDKKANFYYPTETPEEMFTKFEAIPTYERELEKYINPYKEGWQNRYYQCLFGFDLAEGPEKLGEFKKAVCENYLTGLEWTMKYYTNGCPDWRWCYKYHYPPLMEDLIHHVPYFEREFLASEEVGVAVTPLVQLCYVLPKPSLNLLPEKLLEKIVKEHDRGDWYGTDYDFIWAFNKYFWESHVQLPEIPIGELETIVNEYLLER
jgi:5'-3' exonuclease